MILVDQSYEITRWNPDKDLEEICDAARLCYKSGKLNNRKEQELFIRNRLKLDSDNPHLSPLEHSILSVKFVTNRGITHELVRHRLASFNQESTRYCNYSKDRFGNEVTFIRDSSISDEDMGNWLLDCKTCEKRYFNRLLTMPPDQARGVLNNDVKSEIKITANYREWRHIFKLRCDNKHAHYQMVELMTPLLNELKEELPCIFGDINY